MRINWGLSGRHMLSPLMKIMIMITMVIIMMKVLMKSPNDEVKLSKVETNIVDTKHVVLLTQLGIVLYRW